MDQNAYTTGDMGGVRGQNRSKYGAVNINICTVNVNSLFKERNIANRYYKALRSDKRRDCQLTLKPFLHENIMHNNHICCLTDTRLCQEDMKDLKIQFRTSHTFYSTTNISKRRGGVTISISNKLNHKVIGKEEYIGSNSQGGRCIFIQIELDNLTKYNIASTYICPENIESSMNENVNFIQSCLLKYSSKYTFICGDFNSRLDSKDDSSAKILRSFLVRNNLVDSFRKLHNEDSSKQMFHISRKFLTEPVQDRLCVLLRHSL